MKQIPEWARKPIIFMVGLICLEPLRWVVGSIFDEAYATFGWRWAKLAAAMSDSLALVSYILIAAGIISVMIWVVRELLRPSAPLASDLAPSVESSQSIERSASAAVKASPPPKAPDIKGTSPAYRKAVLQVTEVKSEKQATSNKVITSATCRMMVTNMVLQTLEECSVVLVALRHNGQKIAENETLRPGTFTLVQTQSRGFTLAHRDRTDLISNPPHVLKTMVTDHALLEGATYELELELRSQYPHATTALIELSVPDDPDGAVMGKIVSQDVERS